MQIFYFACMPDAAGKRDELQSNCLRNTFNRGVRSGATPHTSRWDAQKDPMPKGRGVATRGEAKVRKEPLSLLMPLSLFLSSLNLICLLCYCYPSIGRDPLYL